MPETKIAIQWEDDGSPFIAVDHFALQQHNDQVFLVVGHVSPPILVGSDEEQLNAIEQLGKLPIHVRGRYIMDKSALVALWRLLNATVSQEEKEQSE